MAKGFWDFMSDWMKSPAFRYFEFNDEKDNKNKTTEIKEGKFKLIDKEDIKRIE